jgi:aryl-alcohol dehydrogenase-like predicted oxidoreductase
MANLLRSPALKQITPAPGNPPNESQSVGLGIKRFFVPAMRAYGLGLLPYFPLASGLLTGKYRRNRPLPEEARLTKTQRLADRYLTETNWAKSEKLIDFAEARGRTPLELAFSWLLAKTPVASVIAGATKPEQIEQNAKAGVWKMTEEDLAEVDRITLD